MSDDNTGIYLGFMVGMGVYGHKLIDLFGVGVPTNNVYFVQMRQGFTPRCNFVNNICLENIMIQYYET